MNLGRAIGPFRLARQRGTEAKPFAQQIAEMVCLRLTRSLGPNYYQMAGFWQRGVPFATMRRHLNAVEYRAVVDRLNPPAYRKISQNKISEKAVLELFAVPSSVLLGVLDAQFGCDRQQRPLRDPEDLERFATAADADRICLKAVEGWGGYSFAGAAIERQGTGVAFRDLRSGERWSAAELWQRTVGGGQPFIIERFLDQHPWYATFHPASLNTFRVWVRRDVGTVRSLLAYLRIGRGGSLVDNQSSGGIVAPADLATGRLAAAIDGTPARASFDRHPDTGAMIAGAIAPLFEPSLRLAERALSVFPQLGFAGIDIGVTAAGPVVIELNPSPDREGAAFVGVATRDLFDASAP